MDKNGKCKAGYYYCYTDKKCKPIPKGFKVVGRAGYLRKENGHSVDDEKNTNGNGNGNGASNSNGNGNGGNGSGNGGNGGGGISEEGLRNWFGKSSGKTKSGRKVKGWVQVGGKYDGKPCARQPGQKSTPKCVSSAKRASMSKKERDSAARRKRAADPGQPQKTGAAKPTMVSTDPKRKMKESKEFILPLNVEIPNNIRDFNLGLMFRESLDNNSGMLFVFDEVGQQSFHMSETKIPLDIAFIKQNGVIESIKELEPFDKRPVASDGNVLCALEVNRGWFAENNVEVGDQLDIEEAKDRKGKGSGTKDACYYKVKSRYSVWPSAYASGALVKCRKVGAANWGNKTKKEEFSNWRDTFIPTDYETIDLIKPDPLKPTKGLGSKLLDEAGKKCWKGYKKAGTQKLFGKTYNRCVKAGDEVVHDGETLDEKKGCNHTYQGDECPVHGESECPGPKFKGGSGGKMGPDKNYVKPMGSTYEQVEEAVRIPSKTGNIILVTFSWRGKFYMIKMFFPSVKVPGRNEVQDQIDKVYPGAKVRNYEVSEHTPGQPLIHTEDWQKKSGKDPEGGLNEKGRKSYERENPGSNLKRPSKKVGNKRRASFCARMKGMKKKLTSSKTANDPDSRINKALRKWNC